MSNDKVKLGLYMTTGRHHGQTFRAIRDMVEKLLPNGEIKVTTPDMQDLERTVAELKAEIARLKVELGRPYDKVDRLFEANKKHLETIASQKRVIEKLIEQRNVYHTIATEWGATETPFETLEAQIAAIEKGVRSEQR